MSLMNTPYIGKVSLFVTRNRTVFFLTKLTLGLAEESRMNSA